MRLKSLLTVICLVFMAGSSVWSQPQFSVAWQVQSEAGFSGPNELRDRNGMTIGIVVCEAGHGLICFSSDGKRLWEVPMTAPVTSSPAIGDLNGDGREEIVAGDGGGLLYLVDDQGKVLWKAKTHGPVQVESIPALGDLDGDGWMEIVVGDRSGGVNCFDRNGKPLWTFVGLGDQMGPPLIVDLYDRPGSEIFITSHNGHVYALGADGTLLWQIFHEKECMPGSLPVLADVEGDGKPELYIGGGLHHFIRIDPESASMVLDENVYMHVNTSILATDIDMDGKDDIVFGVKGGKAFCYSKGHFTWNTEFHDTTFCSSPLALNLDNDLALEVIFLNHGTKILDTDGNVLNEIKTQRFCSQPLAGDFDRDGFLDVVVGGYGFDKDSGLAYQKWNVPYKEDQGQWTTVGGDRTHTRKYPRFHLKAPLLKQGSGEGSVIPVGAQRLAQGRNKWRYDVKNPTERRLVLLTEIAYPDNLCERFSNHVYSQEERTGLQFTIAQPGVYQVTTTLIDMGEFSILYEKNTHLRYFGPSGDLDYIREIISNTQDDIDELKKSNGDIAAYYGDFLQSLSGRERILRDSLETGNSAPGTNDLSDQAVRCRIMVAAARRMAATASFAAWEHSPWAYFNPAETLPEGKESAQLIEVSLCQEEYDSQALNITNFSVKSLDIRVWIDDLVGPSTFKGNQHVEFRRAVMVPTLRGERVADALPLLDQAGILPVPTGESQQLWLTFNAKGLPPGNYSSTLHLKSIDPKASHIKIPVELTVHDLALPQPSPLRFCVWAHAADQPDYVLKDLIEHGVNVHFAPSPTAACNDKGEITENPDFTAHDTAVKRLSPHGIILFIGSQGSLSGQPMFSDPWNKAYVSYLKLWIEHLKSLGLEYGDFALYPYDEPSSPYSQTSQNLVKVAKLIREADPNILIYTDPTSGTNANSLRMWEGLIDIWCPSAELLERFGDEILPFANKTGKETWFYDASGRSRTLSCLGLYRWRFWYAWNLGLTGAGWWT